MVKEFEGKTEKDAIQKAVDELGIDQDQFDIEVVDASQKGGLFKKSWVKIKIHLKDEIKAYSTDKPKSIKPVDDVELELIDFVKTIVQKMGYTCDIKLVKREEEKIVLSIETVDSAIIIGRKGKNLDAIQLLVNVYESKINKGEQVRVILDCENYRHKREEALVKIAKKTGDNVEKKKTSKLLEPMNPFERRLIHTTLNDRENVITKSEGEGLYKRVRILYRGSRDI